MVRQFLTDKKKAAIFVNSSLGCKETKVLLMIQARGFVARLAAHVHP